MKRLLFVLLLFLTTSAFAGGLVSVYPLEVYMQVGDTVVMNGSVSPGFSPYNYAHVGFHVAPETVAFGSAEILPGLYQFGTKLSVTAVAPGVATVYYSWPPGSTEFAAATIYVTQRCPATGASMTVTQTAFVTTPTQPVTLQIDTSSLFINVDWFAGRLDQGGTRVQTGPSGTYTLVGLKPGRYYFWANAVDHCGSGLAQRFEFRLDVVVPKRRAR